MENTALAGVSQGLISYLPLGLPLGFAALFVWVVWRTESWHLLRRRIWHVTHGKGEITDPRIRSFVEEQTNLAAFRIFAGPAVGSLNDAHTLMDWCSARNVDLGSLRMCGDHFDWKVRRVKTGERYLKWVGGIWGACTVVLLISGLLSLQLISVSQVLLSVKASGQVFLASDSAVRAVWPPFYGPTLTAHDCDNLQAASERMRFTQEDTRVMCKLLLAAEFEDYVRKALREQRAGLVFMGISLLTAMYFIGLWALRCASALKLLRRQVNPALPAAQLELDFGNPH